MSLKAIIVDDEECSRQALFFLVDGYCPQVKIIGIARSVYEARKLLNSNEVDLVFLDIAMPVEDGFVLVPDLQTQNASVIFTTAYDQYAIKAIKASAVDYLLKPIDIDQLNEAIERTIELRYGLSEQVISADNEVLLSSLQENLTGTHRIRKINLPHVSGFHVLNINSILYIQADSNYSIFYTDTGEKLVVSKHLKEYENILSDCGFCRIHKSTIINLYHLINYSNRNGLMVKMSDSTEHMVSRRRSPEFLDTVKEVFRK